MLGVICKKPTKHKKIQFRCIFGKTLMALQRDLHGRPDCIYRITEMQDDFGCLLHNKLDRPFFCHWQ